MTDGLSKQLLKDSKKKRIQKMQSHQPANPLSSSSSSPIPTNQLVTTGYLVKVGHKHNVMTQRVTSLYDFFTVDYRLRKGRIREQAVQSSNGALSAEFGEGCKIRTFLAHSIQPYPISDYGSNKSEFDEKRAQLLNAAGEAGKLAFIQKRPLTAVDTPILIAGEIPTVKKAEQYFSTKPHIVVAARRLTKHMAEKPYFMHWQRESKINTDHIILPLEYTFRRSWSNQSPSEEMRHSKIIQPGEPITPGISTIIEMLSLTGEVNMLHNATDYPGPFARSLRYVSADCSCWNCRLCFNFQTLNEPLKYGQHFGG